MIEARPTFVCEHCGGTFAMGRPDEEAQTDAVRLWGRRGDAPGMAQVCDDCFHAFMAWLREHPEERVQ